jgi:hypothetical protein
MGQNLLLPQRNSNDRFTAITGHCRSNKTSSIRTNPDRDLFATRNTRQTSPKLRDSKVIGAQSRHDCKGERTTNIFWPD